MSALFVGQMVPMPNDVCIVPSWQWMCLRCLLDRCLMMCVSSPAGSHLHEGGGCVQPLHRPGPAAGGAGQVQGRGEVRPRCSTSPPCGKGDKWAISTFSPVSSLSSDGLRMHVCLCRDSTGIIRLELICGYANIVHTSSFHPHTYTHTHSTTHTSSFHPHTHSTTHTS